MTTLALEQARKLHIPAALLTLTASVALPFLVHLAPSVDGVPMGARLLPIFIAPLLALLWGLPVVAIAVSLLAPALNALLIGMPAGGMLPVLTVELVTFSAVVALVVNRWPNAFYAGLVGYGAAKVAAFVLLSVVPLLPAPPLAYATGSLTRAIPGLLAMLIIGVAAVYLRKDDA